MFTMNDKGLERLESDLEVFGNRALPFATRDTINQGAFTAQKIARAEVRDKLINRNRFTEQSIRVTPERRELNIKKQQAVVGSIAPYMEDQEFGGFTAKRGKNKTVIPTSWAAGQEGQQPRTRLPKRANTLANIRLGKKIRKGGMSRRQSAFLRGLLAARAGDKFVFIPSGDGPSSDGIYRVWGRKRVKGRYTQIKLKMAYSMRHTPSVIPKKPWLKPAVDRAQTFMPEFYRDSLEFQSRRLGLFRG